MFVFMLARTIASIDLYANANEGGGSGSGCSFCGRATSSELCAGPKCRNCRLAPYCGSECAVRDWPRHKFSCGFLSSLRVGSPVKLDEDFLSGVDGREALEGTSPRGGRAGVKDMKGVGRGEVDFCSLRAGDRGRVVGVRDGNVCVHVERTGLCYDLPVEVLDAAGLV